MFRSKLVRKTTLSPPRSSITKTKWSKMKDKRCQALAYKRQNSIWIELDGLKVNSLNKRAIRADRVGLARELRLIKRRKMLLPLSRRRRSRVEQSMLNIALSTLPPVF